MSSPTTRILSLAAITVALAFAPAIDTAFAAPADTPATAIDPPKADTAKPTDAKAKDSKTPAAKDATTPAGTTTPEPAAATKKKSGLDNPAFIQGYRAAYATIFDRGDYNGAIVQLRALGRDDNADVANLIGYSYRKLGDYAESKNWYERALASNPNHVKTWQYYGLWQVEQGHRDRAMDFLNKIGSLCGYTCPEYQSLGEALATTSADY